MDHGIGWSSLVNAPQKLSLNSVNQQYQRYSNSLWHLLHVFVLAMSVCYLSPTSNLCKEKYVDCSIATMRALNQLPTAQPSHLSPKQRSCLINGNLFKLVE
jgi:hypothetical protein